MVISERLDIIQTNRHMKTIRYFRDNDSYWKFEDGRPPLTKTGFYSNWRLSFFPNLQEFLNDSGRVTEVEKREAENGV